MCAATGQVQNLPDAQNHPAFAYRPETGEEPFASLLAVPVRRAGHTMGVLAVQNRSPRRYAADEVDVVETVAMLLAEALAAPAPPRCRRTRWAPPCRGSSTAARWRPAWRSARWWRRAGRRAAPLPGRGPGGGAGAAGPRPGHHAPRPGLADRARHAGWRRVARGAGGDPAGGGRRRLGQAGDGRHRQRADGGGGGGAGGERAARPHAPDHRPLPAGAAGRSRGPGRPPAAGAGRPHGPGPVPPGPSWSPGGWARRSCCNGTPAASPAWRSRRAARPATPRSWPARSACRRWAASAALLDALEPGDEAVLDADEGQLILRPDVEVRDRLPRALEARAARRAGYGQLRRSRA